jgi:hypothetical protein
MHDQMQLLIHWLGATPASHVVKGSAWMFPAGETLHFIGLAMLFGFVAALDLRMLGVAKQIPLPYLHRFLPWGIVGFCLTLATGVLFIVAAPEQYLLSWVFWWKIGFIALAGANVLVFYVSGIYRSVEALGAGEEAPRRARAIAAASLVIWVGVMFWGRMLPFLGVAF